MICPVVAYAPTAATKPSIAAHPLNLSASGVIVFYLCVKSVSIVCIELKYTWNYLTSSDVRT